ncbi:MAG: acyl-CoA dehydrogenase family protein [Ndongobacter sp.]|nr:acyl-CoA dehydrogenase family protein [Ndongobacter sp.]
MNFQLTDAQLTVQKAAREFVQKYVAPGVLERDESGTYAQDLYKKMAEAGFFCLQYDKKYGGQGLDYTTYSLVIAEISKVDSSLAASYSVSNTLFLGGINLYGTESQKKKYISAIASGEHIGCFGLTEPNAGSDASYVQTVARREGDYYVLNGQKCFITNAKVASYAIVIAKTNPDLPGTKGMSAFIVDTKTPGFELGKLENKMGLRSLYVSEIFFKDCKVPVENRLGEEGEGFKVAMKTLDNGRVGIAAQGLGLAQGAFEIARDYLNKREQFGKPLIKNQHLAFKLVDMSLKIEQAELILLKAAWEQDQHLPEFAKTAAKAKLLCTDAAMSVTTDAVQLLGGNGYMKEYHVERMMRDSKITQIYEGTNEIQRLIISQGFKQQ